MSEVLKPNQGLFLWRMITGETPAIREPKKSEAKPDLKKDRQELLNRGYLTTEKRGRSEHLLLTDKAWAWAEASLEVNLLKSRSTLGAEALEGLLHRLLPFLQNNRIPLAALFSEGTSLSTPAQAGGQRPEATAATLSGDVPEDPRALWPDIERACLDLGDGQRKVRVHLSDLRQALPRVQRGHLDRALILLQRDGCLVLYRQDNTAALTAADHEAALTVGDAPRHLVYLED